MSQKPQPLDKLGMGWKDDDGKWAKWKRFNAFNIVWNQIKEHHLCQLSRLMQRQNIAIESLNCDTMRNACDHSAKEGVEQRYRERERVEVYLLSQYDKRAKCTCFSSFPFCHDLAFYTATQPNASEIGFVFRVFGLNGSLFSAAVYCRISALFRFWGCFCRQRRRCRYHVSLLTDSFDRWCIRIICVSLCIPLRRWCFMPFEIYTHTHSVFVRRIRWASYQFVVSSFYRLVFRSH